MGTPGSTRARLAGGLALALCAAPAPADVTYELFDDQAAFEARLRGAPRVIGFDDIEVSGAEAQFAADRYAPQGAVITAQAAGGQFASRGFGQKQFRPLSPPNVYAPGPVGGTGSGTAVTFRAGAGAGLVAGFGATFIDADSPDVAPCSLAVLDRSGQTVAMDDSISGRNGSRVFRGILAVDDVTGEPVPVFATARIVSGEGWPAVGSLEGVALDDFVFDPPVPDAAAGAFDFETGAFARYESAGTIAVRVRRLGGTSGGAQVTLTATAVSAALDGDFSVPPSVLDFADGEELKTVDVIVANDLADEEHETFTLALSAPTNGAVLANRTQCTVTILDDDECGLRHVTSDSVVDAVSLYASRGRILLHRGSTDGTFGSEGALSGLPGATHVRGTDVFEVMYVRAGQVIRQTFGPIGDPPEVLGEGMRDYGFGDVDGDGDGDLIICGRRGVRHVEFEFPSFLSSAATETPAPAASSLAAGDFDRDGTLDLAVTDGKRLRVLTGRGDGTFEVRPPQRVPNGLTALTVAELDGDGRVDLLGLGTGNRLVFLSQNIDVTFAAGSRRVAARPTCLIVRDVDGDGTADIVVGHASGVVSVLLRHNEAFDEAVTSRAKLRAATIAACDVDGDGDVDLVLTDAKGRIEVLRGNGTASFEK